MANFINAADRVIMPIAIVPMTDELKWDMHGQGWILGSFAVGYISSQVGVNTLCFISVQKCNIIHLLVKIKEGI